MWEENPGGTSTTSNTPPSNTSGYVDWFNHRRILEPIGDIPPAEREANHYTQHNPAQDAALKQNSLR